MLDSTKTVLGLFCKLRKATAKSILSFGDPEVATNLFVVVDIVRIVCGRVCVTIRCPSVYLSVCPSHIAPQPRRAAGLLLWAPRTGAAAFRSISTAARRSAANASSVVFTATALLLFPSLSSTFISGFDFQHGTSY